MHQPRPHGRFGAVTDEDAAAAESLVRSLTNFKQQSNLSSLRMARILPSGAMAIAQDMGGIFKVIVQPVIAPVAQPITDGYAKTYIPMMFSGVIDDGRSIFGNEGVRIKLSSDTQRRLVMYAKERVNSVPAMPKLKRFAIELSQRFRELIPDPEPTNFVFTQYMNLRPTWWSGAMAQVVQIVGGYGRQDLGNLPRTELEQSRFVLPLKIAKAIEKKLERIFLPAYSGLPVESGEIRYDYKCNATHGVGFDRSGAPWLVRISPSGVYAMPLPMVPATETEEFRAYMDEVQDDEIRWALDRFGGLPSGEAFPERETDFQAWVRAGVIIKVCGVADFYQHLMYSSALGWSINDAGNEGFNTCFDVEDETNISHGYAYKLKLSLGPAERRGKLVVKREGSIDDMVLVNAYLDRIFRELGSGGVDLAIKYKVHRTQTKDLVLRAKMLSSAANIRLEIDYWNNLVANPIASHSGAVVRIAEGPIPPRMDGFKFPEPMLKGCVSFVSPARPKPGHQLQKAETILAGYYVGNDLKVIKYFFDDRKYQRQVEDNYDECMIVGAWDRTIAEGDTGLMGAFYTSDFDVREAAADTTTRINVVGTDLGYDHTPFFSYDNFFWRPGTLWRNRYFKHRTKSEKVAGYTRAVAVCLPFLERNAVLHAHADSHSGKHYTDTTSRYAVRDPYSYRYWTHDNVWAWMGGVGGIQAKVPVYPQDGNPVWVVQENYVPDTCSDFADQGPWIPGLPADYTWLIHPNSNTWLHSGGGGAPTVNETSTTWTSPGKIDGDLNLSVLSQPLKIGSVPDPMYFLASPDEFVGVFYRDVAKVAAGRCEYSNVSEAHPTLKGARAYQGWCRLADHSTAHHFIGVINE